MKTIKRIFFILSSSLSVVSLSSAILSDINMKLLFQNSIYNYELDVKNDSNALFDENNPTKNIKELTIRCNFYLVDTSEFKYELIKYKSVKVNVNCVVIFSQNQLTNALVDSKKIQINLTQNMFIFYDAFSNQGNFNIKVPIDDTIKKKIKEGLVAKYVMCDLNYQGEVKHKVILRVPYESIW